MRGGKPGFYPSLKVASTAEGGALIPHPVPFDLFNPLGLLPFDSMSEEQKERGRNVEINNGRAAMLGIFGFISASKGLIVPGLDDIEGVGRYGGVYMVRPRTITRKHAQGAWYLLLATGHILSTCTLNLKLSFAIFCSLVQE